ncbi:MAG: CrcB family protein [Hyphomicrobiales bacterium]|nr:MAG: CrcB family protein [Hyphomicrobiales bacterium]
MTSHTIPTAATTLAVASGGAAGAAIRYQIWCWWPDGDSDFPFTTLAINLVGCFLCGVFAGGIPNLRECENSTVRQSLTFGVLGGFTTLSFVAVQGITLTDPRLGLLYLAVTSLLVVPVVWAGRAIGILVCAAVRANGRHARAHT